MERLLLPSDAVDLPPRTSGARAAGPHLQHAWGLAPDGPSLEGVVSLPRDLSANRTIVLADDDVGLLGLLRVTLQLEGYTLLQAKDGETAWRLIREHQPAVAVLDVNMPGRTGLEVVRAVRADPALDGMQLILLSARAYGEDIAAGLHAGADLYLTKPFSPLDLLNTLERLVREPRAA